MRSPHRWASQHSQRRRAKARPNAQAAPAAQEVTGSIRLAGWTSGGSTEGVLLKQVLAGFAKKYPKIKVTYTALDPYQQNMLAQFAARKPPDVFYVDSNDFPDWAKQGLLEPLGPYIAKYKFSTKPFFPRLLNAFRYKAKLYGFPKGFSPLSMQVNTAMLQRAGVSAPTTWAQLRAVAQRMKAPEHPGRRTPDLPAARVGSHAGVRVPERRLDAERDQDAGDGEHPRGP